MKRGINSRVIFIGIILILSLIFIYPTMRYMFVQSTQPDATVEEIQNLRDKSSIKFGLDLQGGVDILLQIDKNKVILDELRLLRDSLKKNFQKDKISANFRIVEKDQALSVELNDAADYRIATNYIENYEFQLENYDAGSLQGSGKVLLKLNAEYMVNKANQAIQGNLQVIRRRVDSLGLTQPSVLAQGNDRIRIQLPGERDPERVLTNVIRPAQLEFRLVHQRNSELINQLLDEEFNLKPGAKVPDGYTLIRGLSSDNSSGKKVIREDFPYFVSQEIEMTGENLERSFAQFVATDIESPVHVNLEFDKLGAQKFKDITSRNIRRQLAIVLDNFIYSAPVINQVIPFGSCYISGSMTLEEGQDLSQVLTAGSLKAPMVPEEKRVVGATLGADSIKSSVKAVLLGGIIVLIFMVLYYGWAGLVADFALILNVLLIFAVLALAKATLTLSGIGGILLTIGMAVDANVLIYERIREELESGREKRAALQLGFRRAFTVILDSNITTLITALVLLQFAEGSVRGFALTMAIGLVANLFTGLFVTATLITSFYEITRKLSMGKLRFFSNTKLNFLSLRKVSATISLAMVAVALFTLVQNRGPIWGVEFTSGMIYDVRIEQDATVEELRALIPEGSVQRAGENEFFIRTQLMEDESGQASMVVSQNYIEQQLNQKYSEGGYETLSVSGVGQEIGKEFVRIATMSIFIASIFILIFIAFRFQFVFGVAAVIALLHDAFLTLGVVTLLGYDFTLEVVSALLIVIGYSINDTIVIFDRIRETMRTQLSSGGFMEIANSSINRSLTRTLITSLTSIIPMIILLAIGAKALEGFAVTLIFGFIVGTYSSSFVATPVVHWWITRQGDIKAASSDKKKSKKSSASAATAK